MAQLPQVVYRLVRDAAFRAYFRRDPHHALNAAGLSLDPATIAALQALQTLFEVPPNDLCAAVTSGEPTEWMGIPGEAGEEYGSAD